MPICTSSQVDVCVWVWQKQTFASIQLAIIYVWFRWESGARVKPNECQTSHMLQSALYKKAAAWMNECNAIESIALDDNELRCFSFHVWSEKKQNQTASFRNRPKLDSKYMNVHLNKRQHISRNSLEIRNKYLKRAPFKLKCESHFIIYRSHDKGIWFEFWRCRIFCIVIHTHTRAAQPILNQRPTYSIFFLFLHFVSLSVPFFFVSCTLGVRAPVHCCCDNFNKF